MVSLWFHSGNAMSSCFNVRCSPRCFTDKGLARHVRRLRVAHLSSRASCLPTSHRAFSTIQRGHDKQRENLFEKLGFGTDKEAHRLQRTLTELEQGFIRQVQLLKDPLHDPKDAARLEELKEAYVLLRDENFRRNYAAHASSSNDAQLHVMQDGGSVAANFNPEHQSFEFIDHAAVRRDVGHTENESISSGASGASSSSTGSFGSTGSASTSFANTQEAYRNAAGVNGGGAEGAKAYSAADAHGPVHGADIPFLLKLSFEESILGCDKQLKVKKHTQCPACRGSGTQTPTGSARQTRSCPQCLGRGSVYLPSATYHIERKCNYCGGEGTVPPPRCTRCRGRGVVMDQPHTVSIVVPPGSFSGSVYRLTHKGHDGVRGGRAGDLVVTILASEHRHFHRVGADLHAMLPLPLSTALLGGVVQVPTLVPHDTSAAAARSAAARAYKRATAALRVPPCVRNGQLLSLRQHGTTPFPVFHGSGNGNGVGGDQHASASATGREPVVGNILYHVLVLIPRAESLSGRQKAALRAYEGATSTGAAAAATDTLGTVSSDGMPSPSSNGNTSDNPHWEVDTSPEGKQLRLDHCANLKSQYKHWFTA